MTAILIGALVTFGVVTGGTGGNWQAGLVVAIAVLWGLASARTAHLRQREDEAEYIVVRKPDVDRRWWR